MADVNVNKSSTDSNASTNSKRKNPCSPDDMPSYIKQTTRQTKPRRLSYSADDLDKTTLIDHSKVDKILARKPGVTFNIQELICSILKDDSFINKLVPKICESVCDNIHEKYERLLNEVVKPLQDTVNNQAAMIQEQKGTIDKHVKKLVEHEFTITRQAERINELENQYYDLNIRLDDQEQYSRRTSLRFHNVPCPDPRNVHKMNTDKIVLDICNSNLEVPTTLNELGRTHPIGKVRGGNVQVIARFITYRQRQAVYSSKSKLKNNPNKVFITENLTTRRRKIMDELNYLRTNRKISACWSMDGRLFAIGLNSNSVQMIKGIDDIRHLLTKCPPVSRPITTDNLSNPDTNEVQ